MAKNQAPVATATISRALADADQVKAGLAQALVEARGAYAGLSTELVQLDAEIARIVSEAEDRISTAGQEMAARVAQIEADGKREVAALEVQIRDLGAKLGDVGRAAAEGEVLAGEALTAAR